MLEDLALAAAAAQLADEAGQRLKCPQCGQGLELRGEQVRHLQTHQQQALELRRQYGVCPRCGAGFFPPR
jgi:YgiT-type zinc finger domain-containing protein